MSDDASSAVCERCGERFSPRPELLERFPRWIPKQCPRCYRASRAAGSGGDGRSAGSGGGAPSAAAGGGTGGSGGSKRGARSAGGSKGAGEQLLTLAEVLERYRDGPDSGVFTDGSANPNPGPGGWGAVYVVDGEVVAQDHGSEPHTTNNRMELTALLKGIELVPRGTPAVIYSDSNLAVRTITEWAAGWERQGWKRKRGPVENLDLVKPLYAAMRERPELELRWIRAHAGNRWNEYADSLATAYARDEL